ncbi:GlxA family transcriptional regulator [Dyella sp.]|uniref:GlxA family transcriptional regulator n=1 Tax=Dyella sp. TaxID=1869338 RepID=UPI002D76CE81|nr:helix-turn-helix domain-containing protein [Dyella sp.]HET7331793.1 helix-turn-helix domain-containing protein [Dyella sp.]
MTVTNAKPRRIVLLTYDGINLLDLSGPLQAFSTGNRLNPGKSPLYETMVASAEGGLVMTSAGLAIDTKPVGALDGLAIDTLIIAGGCWGDDYDEHPTLAKWIRQQASKVRRLCSVCTGAFLLAASGQLDGCRVATHWAWAERLQRQYQALHVDATPLFIREGKIWTSAGVTSGIDMSLALIEEDYGHEIAIQIARQLVVFFKRAGGQAQFSVPLAAQMRNDGDFCGLHAWIAEHLHESLPVERLADKMHMSPRTFARIYKAKVGRPPAKTVEAMRLEAAARALESTDLPLKTIADQVGYKDDQVMRRVFLRRWSVTPLQFRQRFASMA